MFEGTLDNVVGILYAKDLLAFLETPIPMPSVGQGAPANRIDIRKIMRPPLFVPRTGLRHGIRFLAGVWISAGAHGGGAGWMWVHAGLVTTGG